jgi:hypothetical protein
MPITFRTLTTSCSVILFLPTRVHLHSGAFVLLLLTRPNGGEDTRIDDENLLILITEVRKMGFGYSKMFPPISS